MYHARLLERASGSLVSSDEPSAASGSTKNYGQPAHIEFNPLFTMPHLAYSLPNVRSSAESTSVPEAASTSQSGPTATKEEQSNAPAQPPPMITISPSASVASPSTSTPKPDPSQDLADLVNAFVDKQRILSNGISGAAPPSIDAPVRSVHRSA
jgi:hypothetical protein